MRVGRAIIGAVYRDLGLDDWAKVSRGRSSSSAMAAIDRFADARATMLPMRLLERDAPLATLQRLRAEAAAGRRSPRLRRGRGGHRQDLAPARFPGCRSRPPAAALLGSCDPLSTPRPLGPLVDIADDLDPEFARLVREEAPRGRGPRRAPRRAPGDGPATSSSSSTTSTGPTRRRSTPCASSVDGSSRRGRSSSARIATTRSAGSTRCGSSSATWRRRPAVRRLPLEPLSHGLRRGARARDRPRPGRAPRADRRQSRST